ncbi:hypothetical protein QYF61_027377 [Mycteria americana]|uniref:Secreted protein n=1 Tax=Mycteria americana TaxID=33587 RepID=A0AAN7RYR4_MYCAM|nr:hypothetical protein QYF61_027377 [Mycteria americana]
MMEEGGRTMEGWTVLLLLLVATATNEDDLDLDGNVVAKMMVGFVRMMNLTVVTVCLPTPRHVHASAGGAAEAGPLGHQTGSTASETLGSEKLLDHDQL